MVTLLHNQECTRCPALVASRRRIVHGCGDAESGIVFIGEAPGRYGADQTGIPFWGDRSGRVLRRMLVRIGLASDETASATLRCFITNAVRCCPPGNRMPTPDEIRACREWLHMELDIIKPYLIVPVGRIALREVGMRYLGRDPGSIRALHATVLRSKRITILPLIHPARISRADIQAFVTAAQPLIDERNEP
ncbi:MAG: uracil-DNA glycosylase [Roseiflexus sp.]|nr:uracil-DNA glycosylase [Roseiflexus sp.]MCS7289302.1 uracil-DNA glycosylase [Roseiflexus sp.]MDW8145026.1 uracil-DNA glycosylase [Roseiflexaceae bacterium]MDW8231867.1 uracil-DNA glycosylase [Roseiflexaceae bacterium]